MRLGVLVGEDHAGKWHVLAMPDKSVQEQKLALKAIKIAGGMAEIGKKKVGLKRAIFYDTYTKRAFFRHGQPATVPEIE